MWSTSNHAAETIAAAPDQPRGTAEKLTSELAIDPWAKFAAVLSVLMIGSGVQVARGIPIAMVPVILLLPVWVPSLRRHAGAPTFMALAGVTVASGFLLAWSSADDHAVQFSQSLRAGLFLTAGLASIGVLLWAAGVVGEQATLLLFLGAFSIAQFNDHAAWAANPWKYGFALPATLGALALTRHSRSIVPSLIVLGVAGATSILFDYRSFSGFCLISAVLLMRGAVLRPGDSNRRYAAPLLSVVALGLALYLLLENLLVGGYLGTAIQQRSVSQVATSGSLILGGRPEWTATVQLMSANPQGYGFGVAPNALDIGYGDAGLRSINIDPDSGYNAYMFNGQFRLHSLLADMWTACGLLGIVLAALILFLLLQRLSATLSFPHIDIVLVMLCVIVIWDLAFSPVFTNLKDLTLALFIAFGHRAVAAARDTHDSDQGVGTAALARRSRRT